MTYPEIRREILEICNDLQSTVTAKDYQYTQQPDDILIAASIDSTIQNLIELKHKMLKDI